MAISTFALRRSAVMALRNSTLAQDRVFDSAIVPIDQKASDAASPFVCVYIDEVRMNRVHGRDIFAPEEREIDLTIEAAVTAKVTVDVPGVDGQGHATVEQIAVPETDSALEAQLDLLERQIIRALFVDPGDWSELFRKLVIRVSKCASKRGASGQEGVRFAARQIVFSCMVIAEPSFTAPAGVWAKLCDLMAADDDTKDFAKVLRLEIASPNIADWDRARADLGLTLEGGVGLGVTLDGASPVDATDVTITEDDGTSADEFMDDATVARGPLLP